MFVFACHDSGSARSWLKINPDGAVSAFINVRRAMALSGTRARFVASVQTLHK
jgi:uncharacterized protein with NRDE domain